MKQLPRSEYPRPNFRRDNWLCLNGEWDFSIGDKSFNRKIIVPYACEKIRASTRPYGIKRRFLSPTK